MVGKSRFGHTLVILFLLAIIAILFFLFRATLKSDEERESTGNIQPQEAVSKNEIFSLKGSEIAKQAAHFIDDLENNGEVSAGVYCDCDGSCKHETNKNNLSPRAWRIMANASLYRSTQETVYLNRVKADFEAITRLADGESEVFSLHQLYAVIQNISEQDYLRAYVKGIEFLEFHTKQRYHSSDFSNYFEVMFMLTAAQQHATFSAFLGRILMEPSQEKLSYLQTRGLLPLGEKELTMKRRFHLSEAVRILEVGKVAASSLQNEAERNAANCWLWWAQLAIYKAGGKFQLDNITDKLNGFADAIEAGRSDYLSLQSIAACALTLKELTRDQPALKKSHQKVMAKIILNAWDSNHNNKCASNSGFNSGYNGSTNLRFGAYGLADTAWLIHILADDETVYRVK